MNYWASVVFLVVALQAGLAGCKSTPPIPQSPEVTAVTPQVEGTLLQWTAIRFRLARRSGDEVDSYLDALIADRILAAEISREQNQIALWRFHRRWPKDPTGHQFSFLFFAPRATTQRIVEQVQAHPLLEKLRSDGHLIEWRAESPVKGPATNPAGTSDPSWPPEVQREWPKFMLGASRMWLGLVQAEATKHQKLTLHARYQSVETALDQLWFRQANHALFHHLSALFGYKPVRVIRRDVMTF